MIDGVVALLVPLWQTPQALLNVLGLAEAGTMLFAVLLVIAALEFLRSAEGVLAQVARAIAIGALILFAMSLAYGDFLAAPARAAYSLVGMNDVRPNTAALTALGAAGLGLGYQAGRRRAKTTNAGSVAAPHRARAVAPAKAHRGTEFSELARVLSLDNAGRIQLRALAHNPKKVSVGIRVGHRAPAHEASGQGQTWARAGKTRNRTGSRFA